MSISKGGQSVKPYVGSKEVQEAYVGNQLVYRATPPYTYYFLGKATNYYISPNCALTQNTSITKYQNIYRIATDANKSSAITLTNLGEHWGKPLKFTVLAPSNASISLTWVYGGGSQQYETIKTTAPTYLASTTVRTGASSLMISVSRTQVYYDEIRIE